METKRRVKRIRRNKSDKEENVWHVHSHIMLCAGSSCFMSLNIKSCEIHVPELYSDI